MTSHVETVQLARDRIYQRRWLTLGALALSLVIIGLDNFVLNVALPTLQRSFNANASQLQWMVDAYILVFAGLLLLMGALGDRFGRARILQVGLLLFGGASIGATFATTAEQLIAARAVMGVGAAMIIPSTLSILINVFPPEERGKAIAAWAGTSGLGIGLGPIAGGFLIENFDWPAVFLINVPVVLTALVLGWFLVPDSRDPEHASPDLPGAVLSISGIALLVYAIIDAPRTGWTDPTILGAFAVAAVLLIVFAWWEFRTAHPMVDFRLFRSARMSGGVAGVSFNFFAMFSIIFGLTQYLQFVLRQSPLAAGALMLPLALGIPIGAGASVRLVRRLGTKRVVAGALVFAALVILTIQAWTPTTETWVVAMTLFFAGIGMANVMAPSADAIMGAVPERGAGVGSAMNALVGQLAGAFGVAVIGSIMNTIYSDRRADAVGALPPQVAGPAKDSVGAAFAIAEQLPAELGQLLATAAGNGFVDALHGGGLVAAGVIVVGAAIVAIVMPARAEHAR
jgi:EmrB/QacA subfamily drug resistance transporter